MQIVSVLSCKGGVGKSTICANMICYLQTQKKRVIISDLDPQETIYKWCKRHKNDEGLSVLPSGENPLVHLTQLSKSNDFLVIDTPPYKLAFLEEIAAKSDIIILILRPSFLDYESMCSVLNFVDINKSILVINQIDFRSSEYKRFDKHFHEKYPEMKRILLSNSVKYIREFEKGEGNIEACKELKKLGEMICQ